MDFRHLDEMQSIPSAFFAIAEQLPQGIVYSQAQYDGHLESRSARKWVSTNFSQVFERVCKIAARLSEIGVQPGDKVAILSSSRPEWMEADLAILSIGGVSVSVYQTLPEVEIAYILFDSGASVVFVENEEQAQKILNISNNSWDIQGNEDRASSNQKIKVRRIISFEDCKIDPLVENLREIFKKCEFRIPEWVSNLKRNDLACLVYTSGTTGPPKGVMQTHGNHLANIRQAGISGLFAESSSIMLFLPLAHSFAKLMGYIGFLTPAMLKFIAVIDTRTSRMEPVSVTRDIREGSADIVPIVPRLLEKMREGIIRQSFQPGLGAAILKTFIGVSSEIYQKRGAASLRSKVAHLLLGGIRKKVANRLFGAHFKYCISGGAKLPVHVAEFFDSMGIEILEGYGLTETCVATNVNRFGKKKVGTVGPVLSEDIQLSISEDGEIWFRGPNVTSGYYNRQTATKASWTEDGWFKTGDMGALDADGYLSITGRKKELIVSSNGKKIAPNDIEDKLKNTPFVSQVMLCGEGKAYCSALVTLNSEIIKKHFENTGHPLTSVDLADSREVLALLWSHIDKVNAELANFEQVRKIRIVPGDFTVENGLLTPTFKIRRKAIEQRFKDLIESMY